MVIINRIVRQRMQLVMLTVETCQNLIYRAAMVRVTIWLFAAAAAYPSTAYTQPDPSSDIPVTLMVMREVNARASHVGDRFPLEVSAPVTLNSQIQIPAGALAWGEVIEAEPASQGGRGGRIAIRLLYVETRDGRMTIDGTSAARRLNSSRDLTALSASIGPFALLAKGHDARLKAGEIVTGFISPQSRPRGAASEATAVLSEGTLIELITDDAISSESAVRGDRVRMTIGRDLSVDDRVIVPKGTPAYGIVTAVDRRAAFGSGGQLAIEILYLNLQGRIIRVSGDHRFEGRDTPTRGLSRSAFTGAIGVTVTGKSAAIPAGTRLTARLRQDELFPSTP